MHNIALCISQLFQGVYMSNQQQKNTTKPLDPAAKTRDVHKEWKFKYRYENICPADHCHKCGKHYWSPSDEPLSWSCLCCGNIAYFTLGKFHQQIDAVLRTSRNDEYVINEEGTAVLPKKNNDLKNIAFKKKRGK